jgi:hypothetical protein
VLGTLREVDRDRLAQLLDRDGETFAACRRAVLAGARFWATERTQPASALVALYARHDRPTRRRGIPTLGFTQAVDDLRARGDDPVRVGAVDIEDPPYHFQLFLNEDATAVVACLGVDQSRKQPGHPTGPTIADASGPAHDEPPDSR